MSNDALSPDGPPPTGSPPASAVPPSAPTGPPPASAGHAPAPAGPALPPGLRPLENGDPARVGPYRLVGRIGAGGMGAVYGALDDRGHCVAVKTVHARFARRPRYREAFAREVAMLGRARGVSTARLYAADVTAKVPWLAFDYVPGRDLRAHVRAFGPLSGDMLRTFAAGTAEGLTALHSAGIAHRDIKPGNVILAPEGPKIVDFGIATEIGADRATDRAASYGTPGWVAPERFEGATAAPAADVFAWGALVALAATGRDPYGTGAPEELRRRAEEGSFDVDGVPDSLRSLVERALSPDPAARPEAVDLMRALLPPPREVGESDRVPAERTLAAMLRAYWRGVDDAGHDPARWAAALGLLSAAGVAGGLAAGTGAATGTAAGGAATGGTAAATGSGAAGGTTAAAGAQMATGSSAAGGVLSALTGSKVAAVGVGLALLAGVAAGGYAVYAQLRPDPREVLASAAQVLEEGEGFTARVELRYSTAHAEEVAGRTGEPVEDVLADSETEQEYVYSAADEAFLIRGEAMGEGTTAVAVHRGEMYVYAERDEEPISPPGGEPAERIDVGEEVEAAALSPGLVASALRSLADSGQAVEESGGEGEGRTYSGPTTFGFLVDGALVEEQADGLVEFDGDGAPVRMEYTTDQWRVGVELVEVDAPVRVEDPQVSAMGDGSGWAVVHGPVCGTVTTTDRVWEVQASGWEVDCEYAMDVADLVHGEGLTDENAREGRVDVLMGYSDFYGSTWLVDDSMSCSIFRHARGGTPEGLTFDLAPCRPAALTGETGELDGSLGLEETEFAEAAFEERTLIDFYVSP